jgi:hypothetical protein
MQLKNGRIFPLNIISLHGDFLTVEFICIFEIHEYWLQFVENANERIACVSNILILIDGNLVATFVYHIVYKLVEAKRKKQIYWLHEFMFRKTDSVD